MREIRMINITPELYLQFVGLVFFMMGFGLFFYCIIYNINIGLVETFSNPLFYLVNGLGIILFSFFVKKFGFDLEVDS